MILDERFNHGGNIADYIVDYLRRTPQMVNASREGEDHGRARRRDLRTEGDDHQPDVGLGRRRAALAVPQGAGSVRSSACAPGAGSSGIGGYPPLIDGGFVTAPRWGLYGAKGEWEVENIGVAPDIEVEQDPALVAQGPRTRSSRRRSTSRSNSSARIRHQSWCAPRIPTTNRAYP